eukprot:5381810-Karenia_brevis.AAC.1
MPPAILGNGFEAIDGVPMEVCLLSPFTHLDRVPDQHLEAWALAFSDVLRAWRDAPDEASRDRMLKWVMVLHDALLRLPPRGGRRGRSAVAHRFAAWANGDYATVLRWWQHDRAAARKQQRDTSKALPEQTLRKALELLSSGHISRAVRLLTSSGLGDLTDER